MIVYDQTDNASGDKNKPASKPASEMNPRGLELEQLSSFARPTESVHTHVTRTAGTYARLNVCKPCAHTAGRIAFGGSAQLKMAMAERATRRGVALAHARVPPTRTDSLHWTAGATRTEKPAGA